MKKRILSLILALSMVLSVLPLGAFAEGSNQDLVMEGGFPKDSNGGTADCDGNGWSYDKNTKTLTLKGMSREFDFSFTHPQNKTGTQPAPAVKCAIESGAKITGGTFEESVKNYWYITDGTFEKTVTNIRDWFDGYILTGTIQGGTFNGNVDNTVNAAIVKNGTFTRTVTNCGSISGGTFKGDVINDNRGDITGGTFNKKVTNKPGGYITGGTFAGSVENEWEISGGVFNGKTGLDRVTGVHSITWDAASPDAKIEKVNGVPAEWDPYVVVTESTPAKTKVVTITADTDIFSLNGQPIDESSYGVDKKTVKFTMPNANVVLGTGELVMEGGLPDTADMTKTTDPDELGSDVYVGNGWKYVVSSLEPTTPGKLILTSGTFDFSSTHPQNTSAGTQPAPDVNCAVVTQSGAEITGGTFSTTVENSYGTISDGTFNGTVENFVGTISGGTFAGSVTNKGTITSGTFNGKVTNYLGRTISGGTFKGTVNNDYGTISGGTFAAGLSKNNGKILGGIFNENANLTDARHVTVTDGSVSQVNGEDPRNADGTTGTAWDLYSYKDTTVTITADTEIFSLNGKPIGDGNCNSSYGSDKTTVTFTMPNENVVLSGAITCTNLVMKGGYPEASNGGTTPCKGNGWTYSKKDASNPKGKLTLTDGTYDFSYTYPQNSNGAGAEPVACAVETQLRVKITGGTFEGEVINNDLGVISGGTFHEKVSNYNGMITGGTFKSSVTSKGHGRIFGGVFNGNATLTNVTGLHSITVASGAKIKEVNGMSADWDPYVVVTENATTNEVIITADTEIFSLNGKSIGDGNCNSSYGVDKKTVIFTMPDDKDVVLNGAITCTELVMEKGWPKASNEGTISCEGTDWSYDHITKTLTLTSGEYDFSSTEPVQCAIKSSATITGGIFDGTVTNNAGGTISGGTFQDTCSVTNEGTIKNGTFKNACSVTNNKTIENGTFKNMCSVENNGTINNGTFTYKVENNGIITGGVFNGNANLTGVTGGYNITVASGAKITEVNGVSADWAPYVVTSNATTKEVTIIASTEIFSLNGQPIGTGNCNSSYGVDKTTVTFTMPDDDVVLNKAITSTDLVMENGWPKDSDGGKTPCKGDGWEYIPNDPTNGDMLLLTGSNQTGGLFDFSTIGDGSAVECNVFVGKPTAITGGEFNGKVFNNSGILGGTFHGEVDNMGPGRIENGTFHGAVENNGIIENGTFNDEVKNNGTINGGVFNGAVTGSGTVSESITGSGTLNGEPITKTEPTPEPEPTTYTVTVIGGTIDGKTSVSAKENDTLTVVLDQNDIPDGMTFDLWSISSNKLSGDINVDYRAEAMTFQMPPEDVTIRAQYRSAEIIEDAAPSPLATAATIAVGGAAAGIVVWQGVSLGVDLYLANALPQGVPVPTDRRALALLLWETAGKPEVALPTLYGDIPTEEIELQKATRWAVQNGLMDAADKKDASFFDPDHYVTKMDVFGAWLRLKKLLGTT